MDIKEAAKKWKVSKSTVQKYCKKGFTREAEIQNGKWNIPDKAIRPYVTRKKKNRKTEDDYFDLLKAIDLKQFIDEITLDIDKKDLSMMLELMKKSGWIKRKKGNYEKSSAFGYMITPDGIDFLNKKPEQRIKLLEDIIAMVSRGFEAATEMIKRLPQT